MKMNCANCLGSEGECWCFSIKGSQLVAFQKVMKKDMGIQAEIEIQNHSDLILNTGRHKAELNLPALERAVYFMFLHQPDGIVLKQIGEFGSLLHELYSRFNNRLDVESCKATTEKLMDLSSNRLYESIAKINSKIKCLMGADFVALFGIKGKKAGVYRIAATIRENRHKQG
ncbi:MAG: hypothetical protein KKA07_08545 [Bacteroidetes bacterium]|nr:hypothetical protein [Bacteroidota bacterium]MBU1719110.1 hypothetical protein [Bacteroidota bacterium]